MRRSTEYLHSFLSCVQINLCTAYLPSLTIRTSAPYLLTYIPTYLRTYLRTYIYACIVIHTYIQRRRTHRPIIIGVATLMVSTVCGKTCIFFFQDEILLGGDAPIQIIGAPPPRFWCLCIHYHRYIHYRSTYIHTYIHTYMHAHIHTCMHAYIHTHTNMRSALYIMCMYILYIHTFPQYKLSPASYLILIHN